MKDFTRINAADITLGKRYSAPVFFADGKNMFLSEGKSVKRYHLAAIERWKIPYLLTYGHELSGMEAIPTQVATGIAQTSVETQVEPDDIEDLEEVEPLG